MTDAPVRRADGLPLFAITCGWLTAPGWALLDGEDDRIRIPVPCYLIDHPKGRILFDSGLSLGSCGNARDYLGPLGENFDVHFDPSEAISSRLAAMEIDVGDITLVVTSHLHFDHAGGLAQFPNVPVLVQRREWQAGAEPDLVAANNYLAADYDLGHDVIQVDGEHDLFGDGSIVCMPTYGHTPGHQSLRVRLGSGEVVIAGDACKVRKTLESLHLPRYGHDKNAMRAALEDLRALARRGARIFYGHDPDFWRTVPQAPAEIR